MSSILNTTTTIVNDHYLITGSLNDGGSLPKEVFIYTNTGDGTLGEFYGTCNLQELGRLQVFTPGIPIPIFGNKYVRHSEVKIKVSLQDSPTSVITALVFNVKTLSKAYANQGTVSASHTIP